MAETLYLYDEFGDYGITAGDFATVLAAAGPGDLDVRISSPGGDALAALAIYSLLRARPGRVSVTVDGLAASAASVVMCAASPGCLSVAKNALVMIHDAFSECYGNAADMAQMSALLDKASDNIASVYAERTRRPVAEWRAAMRAETWFTSSEAVSASLADRVLERAAA
jgi:ATP-dependent protease ClpP protease subunit